MTRDEQEVELLNKIKEYADNAKDIACLKSKLEGLAEAIPTFLDDPAALEPGGRLVGMDNRISDLAQQYRKAYERRKQLQDYFAPDGLQPHHPLGNSVMAKKAPGRAHREGISVMQLTEMFPDEASAVKWFEAMQWPNGRFCGHCGSTETSEVPNAKPMPYWCKGCRSYFSVRTGTAIEKSRLPMRKWAFAVYLYVTSLKGVSSMKLHRDLNVTQKTAWFMLHRLREAWAESGIEQFLGPVEADETYIGGKRKNMPKSKRAKLEGRGSVGKTAVVGTKDRATNRVSARSTAKTDTPTLSRFVADRTEPGAKVFTDESKAYSALDAIYEHVSVNHSIGEYVQGDAHTNGIESFWSMFKRGYQGTYHHMSVKHLDRYVSEFSGRHNVRDRDTIDQMGDVVAQMVGKRLTYADLVHGEKADG